MAKQYVYNQEYPTVFITLGARELALKKGDIITFDSDGEYTYGSHVFSISREELESKFKRVYTVEEQNRYECIYERALVGAMQSLITLLGDYHSSSVIPAVENVTTCALRFAGSLVRNLKEEEF